MLMMWKTRKFHLLACNQKECKNRNIWEIGNKLMWNGGLRQSTAPVHIPAFSDLPGINLAQK
jgi:hypothetical protein